MVCSAATSLVFTTLRRSVTCISTNTYNNTSRYQCSPQGLDSAACWSCKFTHTHRHLTGLEQKDTVSYKGQLLFGRYPCCGGVMFPCWVVTPYQSGPRQMPDGAPLSPSSFRHFIALHCILAVNSHSVLLNYHTHTHTHTHTIWLVRWRPCILHTCTFLVRCDFKIDYGHFLFMSPLTY